MSVPVISFYFPYDTSHIQRFQKLSEEDTQIIQKFRNEGFSPLMSIQKPYFEQSLQKLVWIQGEPELLTDYTEKTFPLVKCHIYWPTEIPQEDYLFAKSLFECLLGLREIPQRITRSQIQKLNMIKPYTEINNGNEMMDVEEIRLEDGRRVTQICGGEREEEVMKLIKTLS